MYVDHKSREGEGFRIGLTLEIDSSIYSIFGLPSNRSHLSVIPPL